MSAGSRPAATRAAWPRRWCSAGSPPKPRLCERLQVGAAARVARKRGGGDLRHTQSVLVLLDLVAHPRSLAVPLTQLVAVRGPDEPKMSALLRLPVLHGGED